MKTIGKTRKPENRVFGFYQRWLACSLFESDFPTEAGGKKMTRAVDINWWENWRLWESVEESRAMSASKSLYLTIALYLLNVVSIAVWASPSNRVWVVRRDTEKTIGLNKVNLLKLSNLFAFIHTYNFLAWRREQDWHSDLFDGHSIRCSTTIFVYQSYIKSCQPLKWSARSHFSCRPAWNRVHIKFSNV